MQTDFFLSNFTIKSTWIVYSGSREEKIYFEKVESNVKIPAHYKKHETQK